jgi:hypothetical protein
VLVAATVLSAAIFLFLFAPYPIRHARMPAGFDPPWYIWRATFAGRAGLGPVGTASRPGHAVLSALLGSVTGRSQPELFVLLSLLLPAMLALALGAMATNVGRRSVRLFVVTVAVAGGVLGATRLVGENVANLLTVMLEVGAMLVVMNASSRRAAMWGSVPLLVAAGLAHWVFLAVFGVGLAMTAGLTLARANGADPTRSARLRDEARLLVTIGTWTAAILIVLVVFVLRAPFATFELFRTSREFSPKLITDIARLWPTALAGAVGWYILIRRPGVAEPADEPARSRSERLIIGWAFASAGGVLFGLVTVAIHRFGLPPHRFLGLLIAVPGVVGAGTAVWWAAQRLGWGLAGVAVVVAGVGLLTVPSVLRWYRYPVLMSAEAVQQAETAAQYVEQLPTGQPFVFDVDTRGPAVVFDAPLRERMIRMALPPDRQEDLHLFVGSPSDLLAGRRTPDTGLRVQINQAYWEDVARVLPRHPPVLVLRAMGEAEFSEALAMGAPAIASGVALLQGPRPTQPLVTGPLPQAVPSTGAALGWALVLLALVAAAGVGWTALALGGIRSPLTFVPLVPVIGAGALLLGAFVATEIGVRPHGAGGVAIYVAVALGGTVAAAMRTRGRPSAPAASPPG